MKSNLKIGIERIDEFIHLFENKRVGLITNHTGMTDSFISSIDILKSKTDLRCLFAAEHGIRGEVGAGDHLSSYKDSETNLDVYSLYGESRRPSKEMMDQVDIICFDIQDVGARYYTYIYTMAYVMQACAEYNKEFIVFDRPNPLSNKAEGNILNLEYRSFVGYYPILQRHGLTVGELAKLFNEEYDINCDLKVIPMSGYNPNETMLESPRRWILPSPNIPTVETCFYYLITCYFEGMNVSEGRGTAIPFKVFGAPWFKPKEVIKALKEFNFEGIDYKETYFIPYTSKHSKEVCAGVELFITDFDKIDLVKLGLTICHVSLKLHDEIKVLPPYRDGGKNMLDYLVGDDFIRLGSLSPNEIYEKLTRDTEQFKLIRRKYMLYG
ncbi:DUF1343 domain-containing protein [Acholeplasma sp. OttesenSCG-928-E16]|nr:DUF1343 domain-containing protein [Acholeplasma sp. OttesenSCG-928-E16]